MHGMVTREAYIALHLRVGKALQSDFDVIASENNANMDWAEDITAFSGEGAPSHSLTSRHRRAWLWTYLAQTRRVFGWKR
jgi:hypothetical protein